VPKFVVENALDVDSWQRVYAEKQISDGALVTIGWLASGSHAIDAPLVMPALERLLEERKNVRLHFIGWIGFESMSDGMKKHKERIQVEPWVDIAVLPRAMADFDIGLAPVVDNAFNRAKSSIKALQYWALGIPLVASPLAPYELLEDGGDGYLVATPEEWYEKLLGLVDDQEKRRRMGNRGRLRLIRDHDIRDHAADWLRVFEIVKSI